ncbi:MAG: hypothetical protein KatS3mg002_0383 [Candidatus Woesearchaeota archaeon]|nr:MAG: hypothetical protein KatS3mg002_0383 [Candidatus Woesearchaeota archaeon]
MLRGGFISVPDQEFLRKYKELKNAIKDIEKTKDYFKSNKQDLLKYIREAYDYYYEMQSEIPELFSFVTGLVTVNIPFFGIFTLMCQLNEETFEEIFRFFIDEEEYPEYRFDDCQLISADSTMSEEIEISELYSERIKRIKGINLGEMMSYLVLAKLNRRSVHPLVRHMLINNIDRKFINKVRKIILKANRVDMYNETFVQFLMENFSLFSPKKQEGYAPLVLDLKVRISTLTKEDNHV